MALAASNLIVEALEEIEAMTAGDTLNTTDGAKGLAALNRMIDTTNVGRGNIFSERIDTWTLSIGQQTYTIGVDPAGVLMETLYVSEVGDTPRPVKLTKANLLLSSASNTVRRNIRLLTKDQWAAKAVQNIPGLPIEMYNDEASPLSTYYFYMTPDQAYVMETYSWQQAAQLASTATLIVVPPAYYEYWLYGLAVRLSAPFGRTPSQSTIDLWHEAREAVAALNARSPRLRGDGDLPQGGESGGLYNWLSGLVESD